MDKKPPMEENGSFCKLAKKDTVSLREQQLSKKIQIKENVNEKTKSVKERALVALGAAAADALKAPACCQRSK